MLVISFNGKSVTPMPPSGEFSDVTLPNRNATSCCYARAVLALRSAGEDIQYPGSETPEDDKAADVAALLADKANWSEEEKALNVASTEEIEARRDAIRGYTDDEKAKYIADNSVEAVEAVEADEENNIEAVEAVEAVVITEEEAVEALITKEMDIATMVNGAVIVPDNATLEATIVAEKEAVMAESKRQALENDGFLAMDISDAAYDDWKAQFTATEIV